MIAFSFKREIDAIEEMGNLIREKIEEETKIQLEIQLDYTNVVISHKTLNFLTPPPVLLKAKENHHENYMTITQLYKFLDEIRLISNANFTLETLNLQQFFLNKQVFKFDIPDLLISLDIH